MLIKTSVLSFRTIIEQRETSPTVTSTQNIVDVQEKIKDAEYIIKKIHVKPINMVLKHVAKIFEELLTWAHFPLSDKMIIKSHIKIFKRTEEHSEEMKT